MSPLVDVVIKPGGRKFGVGLFVLQHQRVAMHDDMRDARRRRGERDALLHGLRRRRPRGDRHVEHAVGRFVIFRQFTCEMSRASMFLSKPWAVPSGGRSPCSDRPSSENRSRIVFSYSLRVRRRIAMRPSAVWACSEAIKALANFARGGGNVISCRSITILRRHFAGANTIVNFHPARKTVRVGRIERQLRQIETRFGVFALWHSMQCFRGKHGSARPPLLPRCRTSRRLAPAARRRRCATRASRNERLLRDKNQPPMGAP